MKFFRSTAELEGFNNLILMYAGKRFSYIPPVYRARNLIAAIDHNSHLERPSVINKDGTERYATQIIFWDNIVFQVNGNWHRCLSWYFFY
jgi:hypothetical protein